MTTDLLYDRFKPVRNKLRQYDPMSIVMRTIRELHTIDPKDPNEWSKGALPWNLLAIIRWTFQFGEVHHGQKPIGERDWVDVYRAIYDLDSGIAVEGQGERNAVSAFMSRTLFTQLQYQTLNYDVRGIGRQMVLFNEIGGQFDLGATFERLYGLTILEFFQLHYTCWAGKDRKLTVPYFRGIFAEAPIKAFFRMLSVDLPGGQRFIREWTKPGVSIQFQLHEQSPLDQKPFLALDGQWIPFSYRLLGSSLQENMYDVLKRDVPKFSAQMFGPMFEQYLAGTVNHYSDGKHDSEKALKGKLPKGSKAADFVIYDDDAAVFVEAKGTELHTRAQVYQSRDAIVRNTASTTLKAVIQCQQTAFKLLTAGALSQSERYALIVTYKEYLFGEGQQFWDDVIGDHITAELAKQNIDVVIPPAHIFFLTAADFDWLLAGAKQRGEALSAILAKIVARNGQADTRAFMVHQHLVNMWHTHYEPPKAEAARKVFQDEMLERAKPLATPNPYAATWKRSLMDSAG